MPEYTETVASATTSRRAVVVRVVLPRANPAGRTITFEEEDVTVIGGRVQKQAAGGIVQLIVGTDTFPVINPVTGVPTGATGTYTQLLGLLSSAYGDLAAKRDAAAAP